MGWPAIFFCLRPVKHVHAAAFGVHQPENPDTCPACHVTCPLRHVTHETPANVGATTRVDPHSARCERHSTWCESHSTRVKSDSTVPRLNFLAARPITLAEE